MEIIFTTKDGSKYLYKITKPENSKLYKCSLETILGNRKPEFILDAFTPQSCIQELKPILKEQGFIIENIDSVNNSFFSEEIFIELSNKIKG